MFLKVKQIKHEKETLKKTIRLTNDERDQAIERIKNLLEEKQEEQSKHSQIVESLFKEKWVILDKLCNQYFGLNESEITQKSLIANLEKEVKRVVSKKGLLEIVESVDSFMNGIVTSLKDQCSFLKEDDINFLTLVYAGFSSRSVCMFLGIKYQHFYVKKSRLIKRIQNSSAPDKDLFIQKLK